MIMYGRALVVLCLALGAVAAQSRIDDVPPPADLGQTWIATNGEVYGAKPDELGPIGGAAGYQRIITDGDYRVSTVHELIEALKKAQPGQVIYVEPEADIDCTAFVFTEELVLGIPEGVTLASNRGHEGSRGAVIYSDAFATRPLIRALGPNVRMTGLWLRGPDPKRRLELSGRSHAYYKFPVSEGIFTEFSGLEVDNCEVSGWSHAGVHLWDGHDHHIHHNYIHHNQREGLGYGVCHGYGEEAVSLIQYNLFRNNRHSIAATGKPGNAYEASNNVELGILGHKGWLGHNFDMHGGDDRGDGTNIAGRWIKIHHNTFRCTEMSADTIPDLPVMLAVTIRGVPVEQAEIHHNWFFHSSPSRHVLRPWPAGGDTHVQSQNNAYGREQPEIWDAQYQAHQYQKAVDAGIAIYRAGNYAQARAHFGQALLIAVGGAERSKAQLHIAHCYLKQGLFGVAQTQYQIILKAPEALPDDKAAAQKGLEDIKHLAPPRSARQWALVFSDDFERDELGENWKIIRGKWHIEDGKLLSSNYAEIVVNKEFPGCQRIEFEVVTHAVQPCDLSPVIHSGGKGSRGSEGGYLLQFGGLDDYGHAANIINRILRMGKVLEDRSADRFIEPGKVHKMVAELDGDTVRLLVDGSTIIEGHDSAPLSGEGHDMAGLYTRCNAVVDNLRIYTSEPH